MATHTEVGILWNEVLHLENVDGLLAVVQREISFGSDIAIIVKDVRVPQFQILIGNPESKDGFGLAEFRRLLLAVKRARHNPVRVIVKISEAKKDQSAGLA